MNAFVDTNVPIAYTFLIDPLNFKSISVFNKYENIYWSKCVKLEFNDVFRKKRTILINFYKGLLLDLKKDFFDNYSLDDLISYARNKNLTEYEYEKIKTSLSKFWDNYVNEQWPNLDIIISSINNCLFDLNISIRNRRKEWENKVKLTYDRTESYDSLYSQLKNHNVHFPDNKIVLDAHDYNLRTPFELDFITFDYGCCNGTSKITDFSFNAVKGKRDFL